MAHFWFFSTTSNIVHEIEEPVEEEMCMEDDDKKENTPPKKKTKKSTHLEDLSKVMQKNQEKKLDLLEKIIQKSPEKTDLDLFFISISKTVKKFPIRDQALLKIQIQQIVSEKEIAHLDNVSNNEGNLSLLDDLNFSVFDAK